VSYNFGGLVALWSAVVLVVRVGSVWSYCSLTIVTVMLLYRISR